MIIIESDKKVAKNLAVNVKFIRDSKNKNKFTAEYTVMAALL